METFDDDPREVARQKRLRKNLERLGFQNPRCFICGEDDVRCLQLDHIAGREFSDAVWPLCANCHSKRTDLQKDHPSKLADPKEEMEVASRTIDGVADYMELLIPIFRKMTPMMSEAAAKKAPRRK